jgi:hypothetical protein
MDQNELKARAAAGFYEGLNAVYLRLNSLEEAAPKPVVGSVRGAPSVVGPALVLVPATHWARRRPLLRSALLLAGTPAVLAGLRRVKQTLDQGMADHYIYMWYGHSPTTTPS